MLAVILGARHQGRAPTRPPCSPACTRTALRCCPQVSFARDEALQGRVSEHIRALEAEVEVLRGLKHENIVRYLGTERTSDSMYIFLEYVHGGSIASLLAKFGAFQEAVIRVYTRQILRGLEYLHERGIMHRDIKVRARRGDQRTGCCKCCRSAQPQRMWVYHHRPGVHCFG